MSFDSQNCVFHLWCNSPTKLNLSHRLQTLFENNDLELDDQLTYKQWVSTDRTTLVTVQISICEFVEGFMTIYELCHHHSIKEAQYSYLKWAKITLDDQI